MELFDFMVVWSSSKSKKCIVNICRTPNQNFSEHFIFMKGGDLATW